MLIPVFLTRSHSSCEITRFEWLVGVKQKFVPQCNYIWPATQYKITAGAAGPLVLYSTCTASKYERWPATLSQFDILALLCIFSLTLVK